MPGALRHELSEKSCDNEMNTALAESVLGASEGHWRCAGSPVRPHVHQSWDPLFAFWRNGLPKYASQ